jgi:hypothetical protein
MAGLAADDFADLDPAFTLPEWVPEKWSALYEVIVSRLRREAAGLPMNTVMQLMLERVACTYVFLKIREEKLFGEQQGFADAMVAKNANAFCQSIMKDFNDQLFRATSSKPSDVFMDRLKNAIVTSFAKLPPDVRNEALSALVSGFAELGL